MGERQNIFVCGLGRCGSSLMMQILHQGGVPTVGGWPDFEATEAMDLPEVRGQDWLRSNAGKAVKLLDPHRWTPDPTICARVLWLDRDVREQAKSQAKFMSAMTGMYLHRRERRGIEALLIRDRRRALVGLDGPGRAMLSLNFEDMILDPRTAARKVGAFLAPDFAFDADAGATACRTRTTKCFDGLMELTLLGAVPPPRPVAMTGRG